MYEFYKKEELVKMFPILETDADVIVNFVSADGVMGYKLSSVLGSLNPNMKYNFQNACSKKEVIKGWLSINKSGEKGILQFPYKETFKEQPDIDFIRAGFEKLNVSLKDGKINFKKIAIQEGVVSKALLEEAMSGLEFLPEIVYYEEVNYYNVLHNENKERKELEKKEK